MLMPQKELLRLTVDSQSKQVILNLSSAAGKKVNGRSAYLCTKLNCVELSLKGNKLKHALEGRKPKHGSVKRTILYPLESQLIHILRRKCTEFSEACHNTLREEGI